MEIGEALYSYLSGYAGLTALVSKRIYPNKLPQKTVYPAVTYQRISGSRDHEFKTDSSLVHPVYQISCWDTSRKGADAAAKQVRLALQNYSGTMGGVGGVVVSAVLMEDEPEDYEPDTEIYSTKMDFEIWHYE